MRMRVGDDLGQVSASGFGRLGLAGVVGRLTGFLFYTFLMMGTLVFAGGGEEGRLGQTLLYRWLL